MRFEISLLALIAAVAYAAPAPIPEAKSADVDNVNANANSIEADKFKGNDQPDRYWWLSQPDNKPKWVFDQKIGWYILTSPPDQSKKTYLGKREAEPVPAPEPEAEAVAVAPDNKAVDNYWPRPNWPPNSPPPNFQITQQQYLQYLQSLQNSGNTFNGGILNNVLSGNNLDVDLL